MTEVSNTTIVENQNETENILTSKKEIKGEIPDSIDDILTKGLKREDPKTTVAVEKNVDENGKEIAEIPTETPEQLKIKDQETKIDSIKSDLKLSEAEKSKAIAELSEIKKPKKYWENQEEKPIESSAPKEETKELEYKVFEAKAKEYEEILKDPAVEAVISARKAGKDFSTFLKEVAPIDIEKLSLEDLQREQLKRENPDPAYIEKGMEEFSELSDRAKFKETQGIKSTLKSEEQNRLAKYSLDNKQAAIKDQEWLMNLNKEKEQYLESIKGKVKEGVEITSARLPELQKDFEGFNLRRKDGTLDVPRIMRIILLEKYNSLRLENAYQQGATEKELEWRDKTARPSASNGITRVPELKNKSTKQAETEKNLKEFDNLTQVRGRGERVSAN